MHKYIINWCKENVSNLPIKSEREVNFLPQVKWAIFPSLHRWWHTPHWSAQHHTSSQGQTPVAGTDSRGLAGGLCSVIKTVHHQFKVCWWDVSSTNKQPLSFRPAMQIPWSFPSQELTPVYTPSSTGGVTQLTPPQSSNGCCRIWRVPVGEVYPLAPSTRCLITWHLHFS